MSTTLPLEGHVALVTGAGRGIGLGCALALADAGATVVATDLDQAQVADAVAGHDSITASALDVTDPAAVERAFAEVKQRFGRLDHLVNVAGVSDSPRRMRDRAEGRDIVDISDIADEDFEFVVGVNLTGTFRTCRAAIALMREHGEGGTIVNISSAAATTIYPRPVSYASSKAAILGLTRALAAQVGPEGVRVNAITPGSIDSPMLPADPEFRARMAQSLPLRRIGTVEELAATVVFLSTPASGYITGQTIAVNGGFTTT